MAENKNRVNEFEKSLAELEALVTSMESGELTLEESMKQFERGIQLARNCQAALKDAELRVRKLTQKNGEESLKPLDDDAPGD